MAAQVVVESGLTGFSNVRFEVVQKDNRPSAQLDPITHVGINVNDNVNAIGPSYSDIGIGSSVNVIASVIISENLHEHFPDIVHPTAIIHPRIGLDDVRMRPGVCLELVLLNGNTRACLQNEHDRQFFA